MVNHLGSCHLDTGAAIVLHRNSTYRSEEPEMECSVAFHWSVLFLPYEAGIDGCIGMALSRIGLWSFDLAQLKCLQLALNDHPRRNALTARQFAMQDIAQLLKYVTTMIFATPSVFKWAGLISFISVGCGAVSFAVYVVKERGHYFHVPTWKKSS